MQEKASFTQKSLSIERGYTPAPASAILSLDGTLLMDALIAVRSEVGKNGRDASVEHSMSEIKNSLADIRGISEANLAKQGLFSAIDQRFYRIVKRLFRR